MPKKVLVADDDNELRELVKTLLTDFGYEVLTACDGREAEKLIDSAVFDLAILDVQMPFVDGYHLTYKLSTKTDRAPPKIIILSARDPEKDKNIGELSGAAVFMTKPFEYKALLDKVVEFIGKPD